MAPSSLPGPGWYADPWWVAPLRWWDGSGWTPATTGPATPGPAAGGPGPPRGGRPGWLVPMVGIVAVTLLLATGIVVAGSCVASDEGRCAPECSADRGTEQCADYVLLDDVEWGRGPDGRIVVPYRVDVDVPDGSLVTGEQLVEATAAAAAAWEAALPGLDLVDRGRASGEAGDADGVSVIGFAYAPDAVAYAEGLGPDEVDIVLDERTSYVYAPCPTPAEGGCDADDGYFARLDVLYAGTDEVAELQSVLTHELGHLLGLDHPQAPGDELTMSQEWFNDERFPQTLALGDVLGIRALYGCASCPPPAVVVP